MTKKILNPPKKGYTKITKKIITSAIGDTKMLNIMSKERLT